MRKRYLLLIPVFIVLFVWILFYAIFTNPYVLREPIDRYYGFYEIKVTGLSGKEVHGTTVIMAPIPASNEGKFFTPPSKKEPDLIQKLGNMTERFDNREIATGKWVTSIIKTDKGYMLGFRTNETRLKDIDFGVDFVADHFDIFDPINNGSPILFPVENVSNISSVPYGNYTKYTSYPTYDTYVYLSNNLIGGENVSFFVYFKANNDRMEWPEKYRGKYENLLLANVSDTGYVKVKAILGQEVPWENNSFDVMNSQYAKIIMIIKRLTL